MIWKPLLASVLTCALVIPQVALSQAAAGRSCVIKTLVGDVKVRKGSEATWRDARQNMPLRESDAVRTFIESEAELETSEGSVVKLGENSTLEMNTLAGDASETRTKVKVLNGSVFSDVKKLAGSGSKFEFETPTAVASIRGTRLGLDVTSEKTQLKVYEGTVVVTPKGSKESAEVTANQMTIVKKGQKKVTVEKLEEKPSVPGEKGKPAGQPDSSKGAVKDTAKAAPKDTAKVAPRPGEAKTSEEKAAEAREAKAAAKDTARAPAGQLSLTVAQPAEGSSFKPGDQVTVVGRVSPPGVRVSIKGKDVTVSPAGDFRLSFPAGAKPGEYDVVVEAIGAGQTKAITRNYAVAEPEQFTGELALVVSEPAEGLVVSKPMISVSGSATPGAEVTVSGAKVKVQPSGVFSLQIPIPDEETDFQLDIEASLGGKTRSVMRTVRYTPTLKLVVMSPTPGQVLSTTSIPVRGEVYPAGAEVKVNGNKMQVLTSGTFTGSVTIPDEEDKVDLDFEAVYKDATKSETRTIEYKRAADLVKPTIEPTTLAPVARQKQIAFTVMDRTKDDEITFYREVDGNKETETGTPGMKFMLDIQEGVHQYTVYATDKAGNSTTRVSGKVAFVVSQTWRINMRKPVGAQDLVRVPPAAPQSDFAPRYTVQLSTEGLPDNNPALIKDVVVTNITTREYQSEKQPKDIDFEFDLGLVRGKNEFSVKVRDVNDFINTKTFTVTVQ